jgi:hypothetical protein
MSEEKTYADPQHSIMAATDTGSVGGCLNPDNVA